MSEEFPIVAKPHRGPTGNVFIQWHDDEEASNNNHIILPPKMAERLLTRLDAELHPWGEPGVVPTEPGEYFLHVGVDDAVYGDVVVSLASNGAPEVSRDGQGWDHAASVRLAKAYQWRFRRRWAPVVI